MQTTNYKPCPFCGMKENGISWNRDAHYVFASCLSCGAQGPCVHIDKDLGATKRFIKEAEKLWNERADDAV